MQRDEEEEGLGEMCQVGAEWVAGPREWGGAKTDERQVLMGARQGLEQSGGWGGRQWEPM